MGCRHSAATHLGDQKVPLQLIMAKTRHKSSRTAMRYVKPGDAAVAEVTSLLGPPRRSHRARPRYFATRRSCGSSGPCRVAPWPLPLVFRSHPYYGRWRTAGAGPASLPDPAGTAPRARPAGRPRRSTRRRRPGRRRRGATRPGHVRRDRAQRAPAARPRWPTLTAGPSWPPQRREQAPDRPPGTRAQPAAEHQERRVNRLDAASSPTPPPNAVPVAIGDSQGVAVGPGHAPR